MADRSQNGPEQKENCMMSPRRILLIIAAAILLAAVVYFAAGMLEDPPAPEVRGTIPEEPPIEWQGSLYKHRNRISSILFIGVDKAAIQEASYGRGGGQADFLLLLAVDEENNTVTPIHIDRDTVAEFAVTNIMGKPAGTATGQICLAYAFGTSPGQSCQLTAQAVGGLLQGVTVDHYLAMSMSDLGSMNDAAGGVTVRIDEDLTALDPAWTQGTAVRLAGDEAERYVRARRGVGKGTNEERMARQREYLNGLRDAVLSGMNSQGRKYLEQLIETIDGLAVKDMNGSYMIDLLYKARSYTWGDALSVGGEYVINDRGFTELHADRSGIEQMIISLYFDPVEANEESIGG